MMDLSNFDAISFDCYGTLIDWETPIISGISGALPSAACRVPPEELFRKFLEVEAQVVGETQNINYREALSTTLLKIGASLNTRVSQEVAEAFGNSVDQWQPFADTNSFLREVSRTHKLYILSNIDRASVELTLPKLECSFSGVFTAEDIGSYKPACENFEYLKRMVSEDGVSVTRLLHVSVSKFHDIDPAQRAGLSTFWVNRARSENGTIASAPAEVWHVNPDGSAYDLEALTTGASSR